MYITSINIIKHLANGISEVSVLMEMTRIKEWQINSQLKDLSQSGYVLREGNTVKLKDELKSTTIRELTKKINIEKILRGANETIFSYLTEPITTNEIILKSELSQSTVYRAISDFESIGAITRAGDKISVNSSNEHLVLLASSLNAERKNLYEPNAEILFRDSTKVLKKVRRGKITEGELTGFSLFTEYGIEYDVTYDYYVKQEEPLDLQYVLIHAIFDAQRNMNKQGMMMAMIFYLKHKDKMDVLNLRKIAETFQIAHVWIDVEGYIRNNELKNPNLFLPRDEFMEKTNLYEIPTTLYVLPEGYPKLFEAIGENLQSKTKAFVIGGENMRIKGLKPRTKDIDIVVENEEDYNSIMDALTKLGYQPKGNVDFSTEDLRLYPSIIMEHTNRSRIDLYTKKILRTLSLSSKMISRADLADFGNLCLGILKNEDVFLLKSVTSREGDIQDMAALVNMSYAGDGQFRQTDFDWNIVWDEINEQEKESHLQSFSEIIHDNIEWLVQQTGITPPIRNKLQRFVLDQQIKKLLREGTISIKEIVEQLVDENNSEQTIRNRIDALAKIDLIKKESQNNEIQIRFPNNLVYPESISKITSDNLILYLQWRFPTREGPTPLKVKQVSDELISLGYETIGEIDNIVNKVLNGLHEYEKEYYPKDKKSPFKNRMKQVGAIRICIGLSNSKFGRTGATNFYIANFDKFSQIPENVVYA